jgi:putative heme-binding domain-containing protein
MDRVDGAWLGQIPARDAGAAQAALTALLPLLDASGTSAAVKIAVIEAAARLQMRPMAARMLARLRQDTSADVRIAALTGLRALGGAEVEEGVRIALEDADARVRMGAISAMPDMPISEAAKATHLGGVINSTTASMGERQSAMAALGEVEDPEAAQLIGGLFDRLTAGTLAPELELDLLQAVRENGSEPLLARLDQAKVGRALENVATVFPEALQVGGAVNRGRQIATQHPAAQCTRCHTLGTATSTVGPSLNGIGSQLSRPQLLEALITPSARIAPGFGSVSVTLTNGQRVDGVLREETDTELVFAVGETGEETRRIAKSDIAERSSAASAMPPMGALLEPAQVRDVVEFLAGQR